MFTCLICCCTYYVALSFFEQLFFCDDCDTWSSRFFTWAQPWMRCITCVKCGCYCPCCECDMDSTGDSYEKTFRDCLLCKCCMDVEDSCEDLCDDDYDEEKYRQKLRRKQIQELKEQREKEAQKKEEEEKKRKAKKEEKRKKEEERKKKEDEKWKKESEKRKKENEKGKKENEEWKKENEEWKKENEDREDQEWPKQSSSQPKSESSVPHSISAQSTSPLSTTEAGVDPSPMKYVARRTQKREKDSDSLSFRVVPPPMKDNVVVAYQSPDPRLFRRRLSPKFRQDQN
ncbi:unnamed protein product [Cyprideis torosa]|uniref:Uncharacterized protein n=1 Tax=Cyprideis torosa TaxID=163714 RepID=A0A7R8WAW3_9CRUS|nr:unnamed protein product [Cyprideis torosa]CAG0886748.1 unnamed protein product [Cyprideis torosa]